MRRAYIISLSMLTLISAVSCSTVLPADGPPRSPAASEAQNETTGEAAQPSSSSDTAQSEPAANESHAQTKSEIDPEPESEPKPDSDARATQSTAAENPETVAAAPEGAAPEATLPDSIPYGQQEKSRFLMLSPQIEVSAVAPESDSAGSRVSSRSEEGPAQPSAPTGTQDESERRVGTENNGDENRVTETSGARSAERIAAADTAAGGQDNSGEVKAGAEPAGAISRSQPEAAQPEIDVIRAGKGEQVHLSLPGFGWIFDRGASQSSGVEFLSRSYAQSATEFVFSARDVGRYTLAFQQQDSSTGRSSKKRIAVEVSLQTVQEQIASRAADSRAAGSGEATEDPAAPNVERTASLQLPSFSFERLESAVLARNSNSIAQQVQGLLISQGAGGSSDLQTATAVEPGFTDAQRKLMVEAGELLVDSEREILAEQVLRLYLQKTGEASGGSRAGGGEHIGRVLYLLGRIYESPPPPRDEGQSVEYYQRIVNFYPTDPYRRRAEERIKYLQRHFLQIR